MECGLQKIEQHNPPTPQLEHIWTKNQWSAVNDKLGQNKEPNDFLFIGLLSSDQKKTVTGSVNAGSR